MKALSKLSKSEQSGLAGDNLSTNSSSKHYLFKIASEHELVYRCQNIQRTLDEIGNQGFVSFYNDVTQCFNQFETTTSQQRLGTISKKRSWFSLYYKSFKKNYPKHYSELSNQQLRYFISKLRDIIINESGTYDSCQEFYACKYLRLLSTKHYDLVYSSITLESKAKTKEFDEDSTLNNFYSCLELDFDHLASFISGVLSVMTSKKYNKNNLIWKAAEVITHLVENHPDQFNDHFTNPNPAILEQVWAMVERLNRMIDSQKYRQNACVCFHVLIYFHPRLFGDFQSNQLKKDGLLIKLQNIVKQLQYIKYNDTEMATMSAVYFCKIFCYLKPNCRALVVNTLKDYSERIKKTVCFILTKNISSAGINLDIAVSLLKPLILINGITPEELASYMKSTNKSIGALVVVRCLAIISSLKNYSKFWPDIHSLIKQINFNKVFLEFFNDLNLSLQEKLMTISTVSISSASNKKSFKECDRPSEDTTVIFIQSSLRIYKKLLHRILQDASSSAAYDDINEIIICVCKLMVYNQQTEISEELFEIIEVLYSQAAMSVWFNNNISLYFRMVSAFAEHILKFNPDKYTIINVLSTIEYIMEQKINFIAKNQDFNLNEPTQQMESLINRSLRSIEYTLYILLCISDFWVCKLVLSCFKFLSIEYKWYEKLYENTEFLTNHNIASIVRLLELLGGCCLSENEFECEKNNKEIPAMRIISDNKCNSKALQMAHEFAASVCTSKFSGSLKNTNFILSNNSPIGTNMPETSRFSTKRISSFFMATLTLKGNDDNDATRFAVTIMTLLKSEHHNTDENINIIMRALSRYLNPEFAGVFLMKIVTIINLMIKKQEMNEFKIFYANIVELLKILYESKTQWLFHMNQPENDENICFILNVLISPADCFPKIKVDPTQYKGISNIVSKMFQSSNYKWPGNLCYYAQKIFDIFYGWMSEMNESFILDLANKESVDKPFEPGDNHHTAVNRPFKSSIQSKYEELYEVMCLALRNVFIHFKWPSERCSQKESYHTPIPRTFNSVLQELTSLYSFRLFSQNHKLIRLITDTITSYIISNWNVTFDVMNEIIDNYSLNNYSYDLFSIICNVYKIIGCNRFYGDYPALKADADAIGEILITKLGDRYLVAETIFFKLCNTTNIDNFGFILVDLFTQKGLLFDFVESIAIGEVTASTSKQVLFRSESGALKLITSIFRVKALEYVRLLVQPVVEKIANEPQNEYEVDSVKIDSPCNMNNNRNNLANLVNIFMKNLLRYQDKSPEQLTIIIRALYTAIHLKYPEDAKNTVASIFCLRFVNPQIQVCVSKYEKNDATSKKMNRAVTLLSKILQNIANKNSRAKEEFMRPFDFYIKQSIPKMESFIDNLISQPKKSSVSLNDSTLLSSGTSNTIVDVLASCYMNLPTNYENFTELETLRMVDKILFQKLEEYLFKINHFIELQHLSMPENSQKINQHLTSTNSLSNNDLSDVFSSSSYTNKNVVQKFHHTLKEKTHIFVNLRLSSQSTLDPTTEVYLLKLAQLENFQDIRFDSIFELINTSPRIDNDAPWILVVDAYGLQNKHRLIRMLNPHDYEQSNSFATILLQKIYMVNVPKDFHDLLFQSRYTTKILAKTIFVDDVKELEQFVDKSDINNISSVSTTDDTDINFTVKYNDISYVNMIIKKHDVALKYSIYNEKKKQKLVIIDVIRYSTIKDLKIINGTIEINLNGDILKKIESCDSQKIFEQLNLFMTRCKPSIIMGSLKHLENVFIGKAIAVAFKIFLSQNIRAKIQAISFLKIIAKRYELERSLDYLNTRGEWICNSHLSVLGIVSEIISHDAPSFTIGFLQRTLDFVSTFQDEIRDVVIVYIEPWMSNLVRISRQVKDSERYNIINIVYAIVNFTFSDNRALTKLSHCVWTYIAVEKKMAKEAWVYFKKFYHKMCHKMQPEELYIVINASLSKISANHEFLIDDIFSEMKSIHSNITSDILDPQYQNETLSFFIRILSIVTYETFQINKSTIIQLLVHLISLLLVVPKKYVLDIVSAAANILYVLSKNEFPMSSSATTTNNNSTPQRTVSVNKNENFITSHVSAINYRFFRINDIKNETRISSLNEIFENAPLIKTYKLLLYDIKSLVIDYTKITNFSSDIVSILKGEILESSFLTKLNHANISADLPGQNSAVEEGINKIILIPSLTVYSCSILIDYRDQTHFKQLLVTLSALIAIPNHNNSIYTMCWHCLYEIINNTDYMSTLQGRVFMLLIIFIQVVKKESIPNVCWCIFNSIFSNYIKRKPVNLTFQEYFSKITKDEPTQSVIKQLNQITKIDFNTSFSFSFVAAIYPYFSWGIKNAQSSAVNHIISIFSLLIFVNKIDDDCINSKRYLSVNSYDPCHPVVGQIYSRVISKVDRMNTILVMVLYKDDSIITHLVDQRLSSMVDNQTDSIDIIFGAQAKTLKSYNLTRYEVNILVDLLISKCEEASRRKTQCDHLIFSAGILAMAYPEYIHNRFKEISPIIRESLFTSFSYPLLSTMAVIVELSSDSATSHDNQEGNSVSRHRYFKSKNSKLYLDSNTDINMEALLVELFNNAVALLGA